MTFDLLHIGLVVVLILGLDILFHYVHVRLVNKGSVIGIAVVLSNCGVGVGVNSLSGR